MRDAYPFGRIARAIGTKYGLDPEIFINMWVSARSVDDPLVFDYFQQKIERKRQMLYPDVSDISIWHVDTGVFGKIPSRFIEAEVMEQFEWHRRAHFISHLQFGDRYFIESYVRLLGGHVFALEKHDSPAFDQTLFHLAEALFLTAVPPVTGYQKGTSGISTMHTADEFEILFLRLDQKRNQQIQSVSLGILGDYCTGLSNGEIAVPESRPDIDLSVYDLIRNFKPDFT